MKKYLSVISGSLAVAVLFSVVYTCRLNPELAFWRKTIDSKITWIKKKRDQRPMYFFVGGSSCAFSVIPAQLEQDHQISAVNLGLHAGSGRAFQTELALQFAQKGDVIVLAYETSFWSNEQAFARTQLGSQLYFLTRNRFETRPQVEFLEIEPQWSIFDFRPGGRQAVVSIAKIVSEREPYRYKVSDISDGGYLSYSGVKHHAVPASVSGSGKMSRSSKEFLEKLVDYGKENEIGILVSIPWKFVVPEILESEREVNQRLIKEISRICPVLDDPAYGAFSDPGLASDTLWHLTSEGAQARTNAIGLAISSLN